MHFQINDCSLWMTSRQYEQLRNALFEHFLQKYRQYREFAGKSAEDLFQEEVSQIEALLVKLFQFDREKLYSDAEEYYRRVRHVSY
ncbi:hypothetical protein SAMN05444392_102386 [Seinonella peptonophila]|uniref:Uncharacterized protein n=1 Tax=Seinonella peptonophila TaxID=112248 RepID=A0A1M4VIT7_9BACL|nr:hypothetical protein [Seinonella peptonophila]SHE68921.1 hypothetical protein SAMN05444392_102386 [Seinonella peptonophila]